MTIEEIREKSKELIVERESNLVNQKVNLTDYSGSVHSTDIRKLLTLVSLVAYNILGKNVQEEFILSKAMEDFNKDIPNVLSLAYILNAYRTKDDCNLGLENYLNSKEGSPKALRHFELEYNSMQIIFKYNLTNEYALAPLENYTKEMFAYKWLMCLAYLMIDRLAKNRLEDIPYVSILSELTLVGTKVKFLDDRDYDYTFSYDQVMYSLGGTGLADIINMSEREPSPMDKLGNLFYNGLRIGINLDTYFKVAEQLINTKFQEQNNVNTDTDNNESEFDLTDEDKIAMLKGHITEIIKTAKRNNLKLPDDMFEGLLEIEVEEV